MDPARKTHQNLLSSRITGILQEEIPVLDLPTEPLIWRKKSAGKKINRL